MHARCAEIGQAFDADIDPERARAGMQRLRVAEHCEPCGERLLREAKADIGPDTGRLA
jgi:hypothetical protein